MLSSPAGTHHIRFSPFALEDSASFSSPISREDSFTLLEFLLVVAIIATLMVFLAPAFTNIKTAAEITNAAYIVKDVLEQARTYSVINSTYTWVGFFEENGSSSPTSPATPGAGRVIVSTVASMDGTIAYQQPVGSPTTPMDPARLIQVTRLIRLNNVHLRTFPNGSGTGDGDKFSTRPPIPGNFPDNAKIGDTSPPDSLRPFQYPIGNASTAAQYIFVKMIEFSPRGEARVNNNNYAIRAFLEIGLQSVRGAVLDDAKGCAVQVAGLSGNTRVFQP